MIDKYLLLITYSAFETKASIRILLDKSVVDFTTLFEFDNIVENDCDNYRTFHIKFVKNIKIDWRYEPTAIEYYGIFTMSELEDVFCLI